MNFSALSIRNPIPAILLFVLLTLAGLLAFKSNKVQFFPDIELPIVTVTATLDGAAPAQLETEVARKIEDSVATLQGVKNIYTKVLDGVATVTVEFILEKNLSDAVNDVRDAVSQVRSDLPPEMREPSVTKAATAGRVILTFTAAPKAGGNGLDDQELSWFVDNAVAKRLLSVPGLGAVKRVGGVDREVRVELNDARMAALRVSALDVSRQLRNVQREAPGGRGDVSGAEQSVRTLATVASAQELARMDIPLPDGRRVRLDEVATVIDSVLRAAFDGRAGWAQGGRLRSLPHPRRQRDRSRRRRTRRRGRTAEGAPERGAQGSGRQRRAGAGKLRRLDGDAVRRRDPRRAGGVVVPARLARDLRRRRRAAAVGDSRLPRPVPVRLHAEHGDLAVAGPGGRACWWTMPSSRSKTSRATCTWGRARCRRHSKPPTKSAWR